MKNLYLVLVTLSLFFSSTNIFAQAASITWPLTSGINPSAPVGNIQGTPESIGIGPVPTMSIFSSNPYTVNGQQLWEGNTGWVAGSIDFTRFIQFDASPTSGNNFTVNNVSFNYSDNPLPAAFDRLQFQAYYSTNNWAGSTVLNSTPLAYSNINVLAFNETNLNIPVANGQTFSLRIYPFSPLGSIAGSPSFAVHNSVVIAGTTSPEVLNTGTICGTKFNDINGDGIQNNGELGLPGWTISLTSSGAAGPVTITTTTGADGSYCFNDLYANTYTVSETPIDGWLQISPAAPGTHSVKLGSGMNVVNQDFGNQQITPCIYLCNTSFEEILNGQAPTSYIQTSQDNIPCWKTTASDGLIEIWHTGYASVPSYSGTYFAELNATRVGTLYQSFYAGVANQSVIVSFAHRGRYAGNDVMDVLIVAPDGTSTPLGTFTDNNTAWTYYSVPYTIPTPGTYTLKFVSVSSNNGAGPADGGNFLDAINVTCPASICGTKFNDINGYGIQNNSEPGLPNWTINLNYTDAAGTPVTLTTTTDADGNYCFNNLPAMTYIVSETQQSGWTQTFPAAPGTYTVTLTEGLMVTGKNFGNHVCIPILTGSTPGSTCGPGTVTLGATASAGTINWYDTLTGGTLLGTGTSYITPALSTTTTYYVDATDACGTTAVRTAIVAIVNALPIVSAPVSVSVGSTVTLSPTTGGTWISSDESIATVTDAGVVTGVSAGMATFTFTNTTTGCSATTSSVTIVSSTVCELLSATATRITYGDCCWSISLAQPANTNGITGIQFMPISPNSFASGSSQLGSAYISGWLMVANNSNQFTIKRQTGNIPSGQLNNFFNFCLNNLSSPQQVIVNWLNASSEVVCSDTVTTNCNIPCVTFGSQEILCDANSYLLHYSFINNATFAMNKIEVVQTVPSGITVTPSTVTIPSVLSGNSSGMQSFTINGASPNTTVAITFRFTSSDGCCSCTSAINVNIPSCMCEVLGATINQDPVNCCAALNISNNYSGNYFTQIKLTTQTSGITFSNWNTNTSSDWYSENTFASNNIQLVNIGNGFIPAGDSNSIINFCLTGYATTPQKILVEWMRNDSVKCVDTLTTTCIPPPATTYCVQFLDDSLICQPDGSFLYKFKVKNNSSYTTTGFQLNPVLPGAASYSQSNFSTVSIAPGMTSPEQTVVISGVSPNAQMCFEIALYEHIFQDGQLQYSWCCHSDTVCLTMPECAVSCCNQVTVESVLDAAGKSTCCSKITANCAIRAITVTITNGVLSSSNWNCTTPIPTNYIGQNAYTFVPGSCILTMTNCVDASSPGVVITYDIVFANGEKCQKKIDLDCAVASVCVTPPSGMVAWWPFDEISGTTAIDLAGYNNIGTLINSPAHITAKVLGGLQFDGQTNYVEVPDQAELNFGTGDFSFDAWIQTTDISVMGKIIVDKRVSSPGFVGYAFYLSEGKLSLIMADGSFTSYVSPVFVSDGSWHHIAVTVSRSSQNGILFYLDGVPTQFGDPTLRQGSLNNNSPLRIGAEYFNGLTAFLNAKLDEIELFNRVITSGEIVSIYNAGPAGKCKKVTGLNEVGDIQQQYELDQNYPNPFNSTSTIGYSIPKTSFVNISVNDIYGKEIKVLVNEEIDPGHHEIVFDRKYFVSGIYFYTLKTAGFIQSKKMILMK